VLVYLVEKSVKTTEKSGKNGEKISKKCARTDGNPTEKSGINMVKESLYTFPTCWL
jgi:hypothetical protein